LTHCTARPTREASRSPDQKTHSGVPAIARRELLAGGATLVGGGLTGCSSLLDRIGERRDRQQRRSAADLTTVYFRPEDAQYAIRAMVLDQLTSY